MIGGPQFSLTVSEMINRAKDNSYCQSRSVLLQGHNRPGGQDQGRRFDAQDARAQIPKLPACCAGQIRFFIREASFRTDRQGATGEGGALQYLRDRVDCDGWMPFVIVPAWPS